MNEQLIDTIDEARKKIKEHEDETFTKFCIISANHKDFGNGDLHSKKSNSCILWSDTLPYIYLNQLFYDCKYGPDRHIAFKAQMKQKKENKNKSDHSQTTKSKKRVVRSRKLGCPARIVLKEVITFPDFEIPINNRYNRIKTSRCLRELIQRKDITGVKKFILTLPANESEHEMHPVGGRSEIHQTLEEKVCLSTHLKQKGSEMNEILANSYEVSDEWEEIAVIPTTTLIENYMNDLNINTIKPMEQARAKVREMLAEIQTLSSEINDLSEMESLKDMLEPVLQYVTSKTVNHEGFTVSQNKEVKLTNKRKRRNL